MTIGVLTQRLASAAHDFWVWQKVARPTPTHKTGVLSRSQRNKPQTSLHLHTWQVVNCLVLSTLFGFASLQTSAAQAQSSSSAASTSGYYGLFPNVNAATPQAVAFSTDERNLRFVLDRSQPRIVLLRFEGDDEVWALTSHWGPRGDEFLRNDIGEVMVRITNLGGVTLYGPLGTDGGMAAKTGRARAFPAPTSSESTLQSTVERALGWFRQFGHRNIRVEAAGSLAPSLVYEALQRAAQGMSRAPRGFFGQPQRRVKRVRVERASNGPSVSWQDGVLIIGVVPGAGYAGRPSSAAILAALTKPR